MSKYFTYSVLQYKHSLALGEILNVGILFYFPDDGCFEFVNGDGSRVKSVYPDFDNSLFNGYLKTIQTKVKNKIDLFRQSPSVAEFEAFIEKHILAEDAAGLIFREPVQVRNVFIDNRQAVDAYSQLLLPGIIVVKPIVTRHNENYILKEFNGYITEKDKTVENKFARNELVEAGKFKVRFDLAWENKTKNYIKPISFDLSDETQIGNKSFQYSGLINALLQTNLTKKTRFDFLISSPQEATLQQPFQNALDILDSTKGNKKLITEDQWESYSEQLIAEIA